tara:strand:+ start:270 stop:719 length:450 start_codon:yes stop_codon:yes gene_type:complete
MGKTIPFKNNTFDSIVINQVLEHVFEPETFIREVKRVLKKNGHLLLTVPFFWDEHEKPNDYGRYTSFGLKYLLEKQGLKIIKLKKSICGIRAIIQLINVVISKKVASKNKIISVIMLVLLTFPLNLIGHLFPENKKSDIYLDNIILAKK